MNFGTKFFLVWKYVTNSFFSSFAFSFVVTLSILSLLMTLLFFVNGYCNRLLILFTLCITHHVDLQSLSLYPLL